MDECRRTSRELQEACQPLLSLSVGDSKVQEQAHGGPLNRCASVAPPVNALVSMGVKPAPALHLSTWPGLCSGCALLALPAAKTVPLALPPTARNAFGLPAHNAHAIHTARVPLGKTT